MHFGCQTAKAELLNLVKKFVPFTKARDREQFASEEVYINLGNRFFLTLFAISHRRDNVLWSRASAGRPRLEWEARNGEGTGSGS